MKSVMKYYFCIFIIYMLVGCKSFQKCMPTDLKQDSFTTMHADIEFNKDLVIVFLPEETHPLKFGQSFLIAIFNQSFDLIKIDLDRDLKIMAFENNRWKMLTNGSKFMQGSNFIELSVSNSQVVNFDTTTIIPVVPNAGKPVEIRVVLTGEKIVGVSQKQVGAYIDLMLSP